MQWLIAGLVLFLGVHLLRVFHLRTALAGAMGETAYKLSYTVVSIAGFGLIIWGMMQAPPGGTVWAPPSWTRHLAMTLVPIAFVLLVSAYAPGHIRRWVRHPMLAGVILWSGAHLIANGETRSVILFGAFFAWSLITFIHAWMREPTPPVIKGWGGDLSAIILGFLGAMIVMRFHMYLFGVAVVS